jgi:predicted dithiol-disulfide oxidoreductase (DUF899 family)
LPCVSQSSFDSDFNRDVHVSFTKDEIGKGEAYFNYRTTKDALEAFPGQRVFTRDEAGDIFHTYSCFGREDEAVLGTYSYLDLSPRLRNERGPHHNLMDSVRHHDKHGVIGFVHVMSLYRSG